jgi:nicotinamide-nucleotide amidase
VVSRAVAEEMARNARIVLNSDYAIATTGNAGPTTDKTDKSVGIVFIAIATPQNIYVESFSFGQPREKVIAKATQKALELLRNQLVKNLKK